MTQEQFEYVKLLLEAVAKEVGVPAYAAPQAPNPFQTPVGAPKPTAISRSEADLEEHMKLWKVAYPRHTPEEYAAEANRFSGGTKL
jgi:hypothetical protein